MSDPKCSRENVQKGYAEKHVCNGILCLVAISAIYNVPSARPLTGIHDGGVVLRFGCMFYKKIFRKTCIYRKNVVILQRKKVYVALDYPSTH